MIGRSTIRTSAPRIARPGVVRALLEREWLSVVALCWFAVVLLLIGPGLLTQDSWLTFVSGREVIRSGIPHTDSLAVITHARAWIDQQWLAQTVYYGAVRLGGVGAAIVLQLVALLGTASVAMVAARRRGGSRRSVALVVSVLLLAAPWGWDIRAQALAYLPFLLVLWLLSEHRSAPGRAVLLVVPLLVLWANLHGSVLTGAGLVWLWAVPLLARPRRLLPSPRRTTVLLVVSAPLSLFASPYGPSPRGYYHRLLVNPPFAGLILEWKRTPLAFHTAVFWLVVAGVIVVGVLGRKGFSAFELLALAALSILAIDAVRNIMWFALAAAVVLPRALDGLIPALGRRRPGRYDAAFAYAMMALVAVFSAYAVASFRERLQALWPGDVPQRVAQLVSDRSGSRVYANERLSDWLLWEAPELRGRISYDARVELLTKREVDRIVDFQSGLTVVPSPVLRYAVVVLSPDDEALSTRLVDSGRFEQVERGGRVIVLVRSRQART